MIRSRKRTNDLSIFLGTAIFFIFMLLLHSPLYGQCNSSSVSVSAACARGTSTNTYPYSCPVATFGPFQTVYTPQPTGGGGVYETACYEGGSSSGTGYINWVQCLTPNPTDPGWSLLDLCPCCASACLQGQPWVFRQEIYTFSCCTNSDAKSCDTIGSSGKPCTGAQTCTGGQWGICQPDTTCSQQCTDGQTQACNLNGCNGNQTCSGGQLGACQVDVSQSPPEECKRCSNEGKVNKDDGTACGTKECNPFLSDTDSDTCTKKKCKFCNYGSCLLGLQPPPQMAICAAGDYDCQIANVMRNYAGGAGTVTFGTDGKHCGMLNCNIVGCTGQGATEETCRPVSRSLHYCNKARDFRSKDMCGELKNAVAGDLQNSMRKAFVEGAGTDNEHFHIEFPGSPGEQCRNGTLCGGAGQPACQDCSWEPVLFGQRPPRDALTARLNGRLHVLMCTEP